VIDTAASQAITPFSTNLIDHKLFTSTVKGIKSSKITHVGTFWWAVNDTNGKAAILKNNKACFTDVAIYWLLSSHS
jgi:hypothetical protein